MSGFDTESLTKTLSSINVSGSVKPNGLTHSTSSIIAGRRHSSKTNQQDLCFISSIEDYVHKFCGNRVIKKVNLFVDFQRVNSALKQAIENLGFDCQQWHSRSEMYAFNKTLVLRGV